MRRAGRYCAPAVIIATRNQLRRSPLEEGTRSRARECAQRDRSIGPLAPSSTRAGAARAILQEAGRVGRLTVQVVPISPRAAAW